MRNLLLLLFILFIIPAVRGQVGSSLVLHLPFDPDSLYDASGYGNTIFHDGDTTFVCGPIGNALQFDGAQNFLTLLGDISVQRIRNTNFSFSFYFRPEPGNGVYDVLSKREDCDDIRALAVTYTPQNRQLDVLISEHANNQVQLSYRLPASRCWYHIIVVRRATKVLLYVDGEFIMEAESATRVQLQNNAQLSISASPCLGAGLVRFRGSIDELRIYDRDLALSDIALLYVPRDLILNRDTVIYLGQPVQIRTSGTCATGFSWSPTTDVSDPTIKEPIITPDVTGRYQLSFTQAGCTAIDTLHIEIVDPADLDCNKLLLPDAFTPNGDNLNEEFGISNPIALDGLEYFEIYDRWGTRVFETTNAFSRWDGNFKSQQTMPGVFMYKAKYICKGEVFEKIGSFSLIR